MLYPITICCLFALSASGCNSPQPRANPRSTINDVSVKAALDSGYEVTAVDGKPVTRARSSTHTVVPYAIVEPGTHSLTLEPKPGEKGETETISASFEAGKRYRFKRDNDKVVLVEDTN